MPTLLEKIESNATERLQLPTGTQPAKELARYKRYLKVEAHRLKMLHRRGASGREVCQARATVVDSLIRHIVEAVHRNISASTQDMNSLALVAYGGYGRGELNPFSDIDLMFLHPGNLVSHGKPTPYLSEITNGVLLTLWDVGFKVGHSVRSIEDCASVANTDMKSKTSLIETRLILGRKDLFDQMQRVVIAKCVRGHVDEYIAARIADQEARRTKFGNSAYMQEPNIKNGSGALRDYQNLLWMVYFKYRARSLKELEERELISALERRQLESAYDFLLRVRNELHYTADRAEDILSRAVQPTVAYHLGYTDRSPSLRLEKFMRVVYGHMRNIYLITRTLEQRMALSREPDKLSALRKLWPVRHRRLKLQLVDGFKIMDGKIEAASSRTLREQPRRLIRAFLHVQQRGLVIHPDLAQSLRNQLPLVDRSFLKDEHVHQTFLEMINQRGNVAPVLRLMHETGLLGKYLPEFGKLTCLVQHEFYHQYTADEHTLVCIEKLDAVWGATHPPFNRYTELFQSLERPFVLYLALLLHDAGKAAHGAKHSDASAQLALRAAKRLGLDGTTTHALCLIIEHHLLMAQVSQRRDLDDVDVIRHFARQIQSLENLKMLTLLTFADSQGTGPNLWSEFKDSLLWTLYRKASDMLSGAVDFIRAEEKEREILADQVKEIMPRSFGLDELSAHFDHLPSRYFQTRSAREILGDLGAVHRFMHRQLADDDTALDPVLNWHNEPDRGYTSLTVCTWDRPGLFTKIVGSLAAVRLNILSARIHTRTDGIILDTFLIADARTGTLVQRVEREKFEELIKEALAESIDLPALIGRQAPLGTPGRLPGDRIPTVIVFDNAMSDFYTVIEIETEDRVGLLYAISQSFSELHLDIALAKISTEKGAAIDTFNVSTEGGQKITDPAQQQFIEDHLRQAIDRLDGKGA